jgi:hypothetical protein
MLALPSFQDHRRRYRSEVMTVPPSFTDLSELREKIAQVICCGEPCKFVGDSEDGSKCYCNTSDYHGSGVERKTNLIMGILGVAQGQSERGELFRLIDERLADLRKANDTFRGMDWDKSSDIQRNDREIRWLKDFRSLIPDVAYTAKEPTPAQIDAALNAWFKSPPSETDQGLERSMKAALVAAGIGVAARPCGSAQVCVCEIVGRTTCIHREEK